MPTKPIILDAMLVQTRIRAALFQEIQASADRRGLSVAAYLRLLLPEHELAATTVASKWRRPWTRPKRKETR